MLEFYLNGLSLSQMHLVSSCLAIFTVRLKRCAFAHGHVSTLRSRGRPTTFINLFAMSLYRIFNEFYKALEGPHKHQGQVSVLNHRTRLHQL